MEIFKHDSRLETEVHKKPTDTRLLLHYQSHVVVRHKRSLLKTMLNRVFKLLFTWQLFHLECERLTDDFVSTSVSSLSFTFNNQRFCYCKGFRRHKFQTNVWGKQCVTDNTKTRDQPILYEDTLEN
jgi:hypothetical protein